jgi:hypothetical protein
MDRPAFLSVRVPPATRNRVKAFAAGRGQAVQDLVGELIERFLAEQGKRPLTLAEVVTRLRAHAPELRQRGVAKLWVFGSLARGEARVDSDIDLVAEFAPEAKLSLTVFQHPTGTPPRMPQKTLDLLAK